MNPERIAVIMTCHNRCLSTLTCLKAFYNQEMENKPLCEVFLVDDGSSDGTAEAVSKEFPSVHILHGDGSLFWNRGMHKAFQEAIKGDYDYYLWLNDDSILYPNALSVLLNSYHELANRGQISTIIGSAMHDATTKDFTYGGVRKSKTWWGRVRLHRVVGGDTPQPCDATNGNCVLIHHTVVKKIGGLDPTFHHRWGDHDYCFRAKSAGCKVYLAPDFLGTCSANPIKGTWEDKTLPVKDRIRKLNSPKGFDLRDYTIYLKRHRGPWWFIHVIAPYVKIMLDVAQGKTPLRSHANSVS